MTVSPPEPDPTLDDPDSTEADEDDSTEADEDDDDPENAAGFAIYDLTLRRFVGRVHPSKSAATKASSKVKGHKYETRKV